MTSKKDEDASSRETTYGDSDLDRIFSAAGLSNMEISEAAHMVMMSTTKDMDDDIRLIMAEIKPMTQAKQKLKQLINDLNRWISKEMSIYPRSKNIDLEKVTGKSSNGELKVSGKKVR